MPLEPMPSQPYHRTMPSPLRLIVISLLSLSTPLAGTLPDLGDSVQADLPAYEEKRLGDLTARE